MQMVEEKSTRALLKNTMDPLFSRLSKDFVNDSDLHVKLNSLFKVAIQSINEMGYAQALLCIISN